MVYISCGYVGYYYIFLTFMILITKIKIEQSSLFLLVGRDSVLKIIDLWFLIKWPQNNFSTWIVYPCWLSLKT